MNGFHHKDDLTKAQEREIVEVQLADRSYNILIGEGLIHQAGTLIEDVTGKVRALIVSDTEVATHHLKPLQTSLDNAGIEHSFVLVAPGEASKSLQTLETVIHTALDAKLERNDILIALGGGVIGDLAGFAASVVRRGMPFVQIPTSLLAQVDSSVGGKTGINAPQGKNLIGAFHQPRLVIADTAALDTLSERHMRAGYAEVAKYGLINNPSFFNWLEGNWQKVFKGGAERRFAVAESCRAKASVVAADEKEAGERALLNLGHTFGHALEAVTGYSDRLVHGEAIAIGMVMAHRFSHRMNLASIDDAERVKSHFERVGLPTELSHIPGERFDLEAILAAIAQDKKVSRGALTFILTKGIGEALIAKDVPQSEVRSFLLESLMK